MPILLLIAALGFIVYGSGALAMNGLSDVSPKSQGGGYRTDFDSQILAASKMTGVPFALIKAHAIQESSLKSDAFTDESANRADRVGWASRGLLQVLWWPGSNRFAKYGYPDGELMDGELLFDPNVCCEIAAKIIKDNLKTCSGNLRDSVNMYNTGKKESAYQAPGNYVDKVIGYYNKILNKGVS